MTKAGSIRLPPGEDVNFVQSHRSGVAHVVAPAPDVLTDEPRPATGADIARFLLGATPAACGRTIHRNRGGIGAHAEFASQFPDDLLCRDCYRAVHPDDACRLFEHE